MKKIRKILIFLMVIALLSITIPVNAEMVKIPKVSGSDYVKHPGGDYVYVNADYDVKNSDFRGVWVSPLVDDIPKYSSKEQYKSEIISVLDTMEVYNLNVLIFHVRIMNDAIYTSQYSKWSIYYNENPDWDPLPWVIEECHKRGIEFHAWMNPYRVRNGQHNLEKLAREFTSNNMASNPDNLLQGTNAVILNPGIPRIKKWLVDVCMEVVKNYDVDAIHFDDYFYDHGVNDSKTRLEYNTDNLSLGDFRRKQVDDFIQNLSYNIRKYNQETGRRVQLGISPSGVYLSGDGKVTYDANGNAYSNGSLTTTTYIHYDNYLYSDTLKWINNEWIDYILPQCYWSIEHPMCPYADLLDWWNRVAKYKKVNVYSGIGLGDYGQNKYSWISDTEAYYEIMLANGMENVQGVAFFSYKTYKKALWNPKMLTNVDKIWSIRSLTPENRNCEKIVPEKTSGLEIYKNTEGFTLRWDCHNTDKFYAIYRSTDTITFNPEELIAVVGKNTGEDGKIEFVDDEVLDNVTYNYGVKAQSNSLTLGEGEIISSTSATEEKQAYLGNLKAFFTSGLSKGNESMLVFEKLNYYKGDDVKYEFEYSFDDGEVKKITSFKSREGSYYTYIKALENSNKLHGVLKAYNDIAYSEVVFDLDVSESLSKITNFGIVSYDHDTFYEGDKVGFIFNAHEIDGLTYYIEYSSDGFEWNDFYKIEQTNTSLNYRIKINLHEGLGKQYYRIKATNGVLSSYSDAYTIDVYKSMNSIKNLKINNKAPLNIYHVKENDIIKFTWNVTTLSGANPNEAIYYSLDGNSWYALKLYGKVTSSNTSSLYDYELTISGNEYKIYIKVFSELGDLKNESETFTFYIDKSFTFYDDFSIYLNREVKEMNRETSIFK